MRYGDVLNLIQADETDRVVERKEIPLFDNKAFREAVINAVLHNKWVEGNEPMISVFSDRIEILSRGTLAPAQTMEGFFLGESIPVNEKLSEIFLQLHISEKSGRGVPKITEMYGKDAFSFRENSIVVTIPFERINKVGNKVGKKVGDKKSLNSRRQKIISEMRDKHNFKHKNKNVLLGKMLFHWEARAVMFIVLIWLLVWEIFLIMELANRGKMFSRKCCLSAL